MEGKQVAMNILDSKLHEYFNMCINKAKVYLVNIVIGL